MITFIGDYPEPDSLRAAIRFATHDAATLAAVLEVAEARRDFESHRPHGTGVGGGR